MDKDTIKTLASIVERAQEHYYRIGMQQTPSDPVKAAHLSTSFEQARSELWAAQDALKAALAKNPTNGA
jgi:hypothetical protein